MKPRERMDGHGESDGTSPIEMKRIALLYERGVENSEQLVNLLEAGLTDGGYSSYVDRHLRISMDWARSVDEAIRRSDAVIVIFSTDSDRSEMLNYEIEIATDAKLKNPAMVLCVVPTSDEAAALAASGPLVNACQTPPWHADSSSPNVIATLLDFLAQPMSNLSRAVLLGSSGGGVSNDSPYYIERPADAALKECLSSSEATVLIKGARQTGKTSLIGQGLKYCVRGGYRSYVSDFQKLGSSLYGDETKFYRLLIGSLSRQAMLSHDLDIELDWDPSFGLTSNLDDFIRSLLKAQEDRVVWFMDEADALFASNFASSFFALVRSWHNSRALGADPIWERFSVVISYATEAHLLIQEINQSPFNVGQRIDLAGFTLRQTEELNKRYGEPLRGIDQVLELYELLDGQPYLTRVAFDFLIRSQGNLRGLLAGADRDEGPFGEHLRRVLVSVTQLADVRATIQSVLDNKFVEASAGTDRLVTAGILVRNSSGNHVFQCNLYRKYLARHFA